MRADRGRRRGEGGAGGSLALVLMLGAPGALAGEHLAGVASFSVLANLVAAALSPVPSR